MNLKFTQTGKYLIAAGCQQNGVSDAVSPLLFISVIGAKGWATHYPMQGSYRNGEEASAAALHYGIRIITRQCKEVARPGAPADTKR